MAVNSGDIIEVSARGEFDGTEDVVNVYQFKLTSAGPITDTEAVSDLLDLLDDLYVLWVPKQTTNYIYRDVRFANQTQSTLMGTFPWGAVTAGTNVGESLPPGNAAVLNLGTAIPRVILRKFIGGITKALIDADGTWDASIVTAMLNMAAILLAQWTGSYGTWEYGFFSPKTLQWETPVAATATDIVGYQRRRKQGRGS